MANLGLSDSNSSMSRKGSSSSTRYSVLPQFLTDLITSSSQSSAPKTQLIDNEDTFLNGLLTRDNAAQQGQSYLTSALSDLPPGDFTGHDNLTAMAERNPFSSAYETATAAKYSDRVDEALARLATGPDVVRSGTARTALAQGEAANRMALERSDEVRKQQVVDATLATQAAQMLHAIESGRRATLMTGQNQLMAQYLAGMQQSLDAAKQVDVKQNNSTALMGLASKALATDKVDASEDYTGKGSQASTTWSTGINCCFIFIEGLDGRFPWFVRRARDIFYEEQPLRGVGYVWMSRWLVPLMRTSHIIKRIVQAILITPCVKYGAWMFGEEHAKKRWRFYGPYVQTWFKLWELIGRRVS